MPHNLECCSFGGGDGLVTKLCVTLWDPVDCSPQASLSMRSSRQECWSRLPFPSPGNLPNPGIKLSAALKVDSLPTEPQGKPKNTGAGSLSFSIGSY